MGNRVLARAKWHAQKGLTEETSIARLFTEAEQGLRKPAKDHEMTRDLQQREAVTPPRSEGTREGRLLTKPSKGWYPGRIF